MILATPKNPFSHPFKIHIFPIEWSSSLYSFSLLSQPHLSLKNETLTVCLSLKMAFLEHLTIIFSHISLFHHTQPRILIFSMFLLSKTTPLYPHFFLLFFFLFSIFLVFHEYSWCLPMVLATCLPLVVSSKNHFPLIDVLPLFNSPFKNSTCSKKTPSFGKKK